MAMSGKQAKAAHDYKLRFTPAEWRMQVEDPSFLTDPGNSYQPRRLMGVPVQIIPSHQARYVTFFG